MNNTHSPRGWLLRGLVFAIALSAASLPGCSHHQSATYEERGEPLLVVIDDGCPAGLRHSAKMPECVRVDETAVDGPHSHIMYESLEHSFSYLGATIPSLVFIDVADETGLATPQSIAQGIEKAISLHADVISLSYTAAISTKELSSAVADAHAEGIIIIAATANINTGQASFPADYPEVISIGITGGTLASQGDVTLARDDVEALTKHEGSTSTSTAAAAAFAMAYLMEPSEPSGNPLAPLLQ